MLEERVVREVLADREQEDGEMQQERPCGIMAAELPSRAVWRGSGPGVSRRGGRKLGGGPMLSEDRRRSAIL